ncbi:MAG: hypothetical protein A2W25_01890 [candidate division Zixibacteria bacterium RBG_16_53_22]|nr:MAG: hypothetical protein A2W25_01890 [candidate division Zixibacteria bacterium RBG_16_53_22]
MHSTLASTSLLGLIVMLVIVGAPVYVLLLSAMFGGPKVGRVRGVFIGSVVAILAIFIAFTFVFSGIMSLIFPQ